MNRGIVYLATGKEIYFEECRFSATSVKKYCPDIPITLFTDRSRVKGNCFDEVITIANDLHPFKNKVRCLSTFPYDYTLYLDTDTQVKQPIYEMFDWLDKFDLGVANSPYRNQRKSKLIDYSKPNQYNTGVVLFKKSEKNKKFFDKWLENIMQQDETDMWSGHNGDQANFNRLIKENYHVECGINLKVFPNKLYNARPAIIKQMKQNGEINKVKIVHSHCLHMNPLSLLLWKANRKMKKQSTRILTQDALVKS